MQDNIGTRNPVQAYLLDKQGNAEELTYEEIDTVDKSDKILWLHFDYTSPEAIDWITNRSCIDSIAIDALGLFARSYPMGFSNGIVWGHAATSTKLHFVSLWQALVSTFVRQYANLNKLFAVELAQAQFC